MPAPKVPSVNGEMNWGRGSRGLASYFLSGAKTKNERRTMTLRRVVHTVYSAPKRLSEHDAFLREHRAEIKVFADIGAANSIGAPTSFDAKHALGADSRVVAIDIMKFNADAAKKNLAGHKMPLKQGDVEPMFHSLSRKPLPFKCDALRLATVTNYMTESERRRTLVNAWKSLRPGGYLLGAQIRQQFVLQKTKRGFRMVKDW